MPSEAGFGITVNDGPLERAIKKLSTDARNAKKEIKEAQKAQAQTNLSGFRKGGSLTKEQAQGIVKFGGKEISANEKKFLKGFIKGEAESLGLFRAKESAQRVERALQSGSAGALTNIVSGRGGIRDAGTLFRDAGVALSQTRIGQKVAKSNIARKLIGKAARAAQFAGPVGIAAGAGLAIGSAIEKEFDPVGDLLRKAKASGDIFDDPLLKKFQLEGRKDLSGIRSQQIMNLKKDLKGQAESQLSQFQRFKSAIGFEGQETENLSKMVRTRKEISVLVGTLFGEEEALKKGSTIIKVRDIDRRNALDKALGTEGTNLAEGKLGQVNRETFAEWIRLTRGPDAVNHLAEAEAAERTKKELESALKTRELRETTARGFAMDLQRSFNFHEEGRVKVEIERIYRPKISAVTRS